MMDDPIEIGWRGLKDRACADPEAAKRCVMVTREDYVASFAALEARRWRVVRPDKVTGEMADAAFRVLNNLRAPDGDDYAEAAAKVIRAAPTYATPAKKEP